MSDEMTKADVGKMADFEIKAAAQSAYKYPSEVRLELESRRLEIEESERREQEAKRAAERAKDPVAFDKKEKEERAKEVFVNIALVVAGFLFIGFSKFGPKDESKTYDEKQKERQVQFEKDMTATSSFKRSAINPLDTPQGAIKLRDVFNLLKAKKEKEYSFVVLSHGNDYPDETTYVLVPPVKQLMNEKSLIVCVDSPVIRSGAQEINGDYNYVPFSSSKLQFTQKVPPFNVDAHVRLHSMTMNRCSKLMSDHIPYDRRERAKTYFVDIFSGY